MEVLTIRILNTIQIKWSFIPSLKPKKWLLIKKAYIKMQSIFITLSRDTPAANAHWYRLLFTLVLAYPPLRIRNTCVEFSHFSSAKRWFLGKLRCRFICFCFDKLGETLFLLAWFTFYFNITEFSTLMIDKVTSESETWGLTLSNFSAFKGRFFKILRLGLIKLSFSRAWKQLILLLLANENYI